MAAPLFTTGFLNAALFTLSAISKRIVRFMYNMNDIEPLSVFQVVISSQITAPFYVSLVVPIEQIKIKLQLQKDGASRLYKGPLDCAVKIVRSDGVLGLWRGFVPTLGMRLAGLPAYFGGYEFSKQMLVKPGEQATSLELLLSGGIAGIAFWSVIFPLDTLKTKMQSNSNHKGSFFSSVTGVWKSEGAAGFYKGFLPCILRAFPANAFCFLAVEWVHSLYRHLSG